MVATKIGGYELDEHLFMDEKLSFFDTNRKSVISLRGGGGKLHVFAPWYDQMQYFGRLSYPSPDGETSAFTHTDPLCQLFFFYGAARWEDFREELRYIKKTGILVNRYENNHNANWPKDLEFEAYFFSHQVRRAFIQLRYVKNNAAEPRTVKFTFFTNLKIGGDEANDQGVWDSNRKAFRCWDAVNSKACYLLIGSPTTPTHRGIDQKETIGGQCYYGLVVDKDSYGPGDAAVGFQFDITLAAGASTILPFYFVVGDSQADVESEWDILTAKTYSEILADTKEAWETWVNQGVVATFEDNPWLSEAWIRNVISAYEMTWSNGGISATWAMYLPCFPWDSYFAIRTLLQAGHLTEIQNYLAFMRTAVALDDFIAYPASSYNYAYYGDAGLGGPDLVHGCYCTPMLVWDLYQKTKTLTDLSDNWDMVKKYLDYVKDNFYNQTGYNLISGKGMLDHPYRYHPGWAENKYYAKFQLAYYYAFLIGSQIADLTSHPTEKTFYKQVSDELKASVDSKFLVDGIYKSVWHPTQCPTGEGWDIELSSLYGEVGYDLGKKTFREWEKWLKDYFPAHYDYVNYSEGQNWLYIYALADLLHSLILYGDYENFMTLLSRYKYVANYPKLGHGERTAQYETSSSQVIFAWSHAVVGALGCLFDWTKDADGNYVFSLSPAPQAGKFKAEFSDGTSVTVEGEGKGPFADIQIKPYSKAYTWDSENKKLNVTVKPGEDMTFKVAMGSLGMQHRARFKTLLNQKGEFVEVMEKTKVGSNGFGTPMYEWLTKNVERAFVQPLKGDEAVIKAGLLALGDAEAMFDPFSTVAKNYRVRVGGIVYEIVSLERIKSHGSTVYVRANLKRVIE